MSTIRNKIESLFESFAYRLFNHRFKIVFIMLIIITGFASQIPKITMDTSTEGFLHYNDPILIDYEAFRDQFGRDEMAIVALTPSSPDDTIFSHDFLQQLKALHEDLAQNLPYLDDITSLVNARNTYGKTDELIVEDLLEHWPETPEDFKALENRARTNVMYKNLLLAEDREMTTIVIQTHTYSNQEGGDDQDFSGFEEEDTGVDDAGTRQYLTDKENSEFVAALETIVKRHQSDRWEMLVAGSPVVTDFLKRSMMENMRQFMAIALVTIALFLMVMFRRVSGVLMPILIVTVSLVSTLGLMAVLKIPIKLPTQILPSFLLSVAVGASVHVLVIFFQKFDTGSSKVDSIAHALGHSGLAIVMTSLTTAGGLLSFSTAEVAPVADLGKMAAAGVLLSLFYTICLLPALLSILPVKPKTKPIHESTQKTSAVDRMINGCVFLSVNYPKQILVTALILVILSIAGATRINLSHDPVRWLPDNSQVRQANEILDTALKGTTSLEVILDTGQENGLYDPQLLSTLDESAAIMEAYENGSIFVGKAWSITAVVKETNQALHENNAAFYTIPTDRELVAQELFLFENSGSDDLEDLTDTQFSKARFTLKVPFVDAVAYSHFMDTVNDHFKSTYPDHSFTVTGMVAILSQVITNAIHSMLKSYGYALIVITCLMIILIGRVRIGMFSMIPNIFPIILMLGVMGWFGLPMDLFCMMVGSIAIGLAVDDTIHFMHNFRRYYEKTHDPELAITKTLHTAGKAMLVTTCVLSIGFFTFMFSEMNNLFNFGLLTGFTLIMALMADYFVAPALMILLNKKKTAIVSTGG